jgi:hypothetical protein
MRRTRLGCQREGTGQLQDGHRHAQHPGQERDQDQPEGPAPSPHDTDGKQRDETGQCCQEGDFRRTAGARQAEGLVVDLRGRHQDRQEADPIHQEKPSTSAWVLFTFTIAQQRYQARIGTVALSGHRCDALVGSGRPWRLIP